MSIQIRQETLEDYSSVEEVIRSAFKNESLGEPTEHLLVKRLRYSSAFVPELSLVAETKNKIVGHILLSKVTITDGRKVQSSLSLAPVSVLPAYQGIGIGSRLIHTAHKIARSMGFSSVILLGHENYYPRFGYKKLKIFNINLPFDAPEENCMGLELLDAALSSISGEVKYPEEFFI